MDNLNLSINYRLKLNSKPTLVTPMVYLLFHNCLSYVFDFIAPIDDFHHRRCIAQQNKVHESKCFRGREYRRATILSPFPGQRGLPVHLFAVFAHGLQHFFTCGRCTDSGSRCPCRADTTAYFIFKRKRFVSPAQQSRSNSKLSNRTFYSRIEPRTSERSTRLNAAYNPYVRLS